MNEPSREQIVADGFAKVEEGAKFLSVGRSTVYELMDSGALPYCKIGRARRIPWYAIRKFAEDSLRLPE
jgi:excisionase family DNA binding protein